MRKWDESKLLVGKGTVTTLTHRPWIYWIHDAQLCAKAIKYIIKQIHQDYYNKEKKREKTINQNRTIARFQSHTHHEWNIHWFSLFVLLFCGFWMIVVAQNTKGNNMCTHTQQYVDLRYTLLYLLIFFFFSFTFVVF